MPQQTLRQQSLCTIPTMGSQEIRLQESKIKLKKMRWIV